MDQDFLEGIDDQFQRLMKLHGGAKRNGRSSPRSPEDRVTLEILEIVQALSKTQKEALLAHLQQVKKAE